MFFLNPILGLIRDCLDQFHVVLRLLQLQPEPFFSAPSIYNHKYRLRAPGYPFNILGLFPQPHIHSHEPSILNFLVSSSLYHKLESDFFWHARLHELHHPPFVHHCRPHFTTYTRSEIHSFAPRYPHPSPILRVKEIKTQSPSQTTPPTPPGTATGSAVHCATSPSRTRFLASARRPPSLRPFLQFLPYYPRSSPWFSHPPSLFQLPGFWSLLRPRSARSASSPSLFRCGGTPLCARRRRLRGS